MRGPDGLCGRRWILRWQRVRRFLDGAAEEVVVFKHGGLFGVEPGEIVEGPIEVQHLLGDGAEPGEVRGERDAGRARAALSGADATSVVNEGHAHEPGAGIEEVEPIFKLAAGLRGELKEEF